MIRGLVLASGLFAGAIAGEDAWGSDRVTFVSDGGWNAYREKNPKFLAVFYAPWCGHCKALKPAFGEAAEELQFRVPLVAVDCTDDGKSTCSEFGVQGFPTIKWFDSSDGAPEDYESGRDKSDFVKFVTDKVGDEPENFDGVDFSTFKIRQLKKILFDRGQTCAGCSEKHDFIEKVKASIHLPKSGPPKKNKKKKKGSSLVNGRTVAQERRYKIAKEVADKGWDNNGDVIHLIEDNFEKFREEKGPIFTMFYAPWCGHCTNLKPAMAEASTALVDTLPVTAVDCDTNSDLCQRYRARSYPTLIYFPDAKSKGEAFNGPRTAKGLIRELNTLVDPDFVAPVEPFVNEPLWDDNGKVVHMTDDHWDAYRTEQPQMFVLFYAPWCGHCKAIKPAWASSSEQVEMPMVAVDCTEHAGVCSKFGVSGYPTIKFFDSSESDGEDYSGGRSHDDLVAFVQSKHSGQAKEEL